MVRVLSACPGEPLPSGGRAAPPAPARRLEYTSYRDADGDGVVCER